MTRGRPSGEDAQPRGPAQARLGRVHDRVLDALARVGAGSPADRALAEVFRGARDLGAKERARVSDLTYGVLRHRRTTDDLLARASRGERRKLDLVEPPILDRLRVLAYLATRGAELAELEALDAYATRRLPGVMRRIVQGRVPPAKHSEREALAVELSLPSWLFDRLADAFGEARAAAIGRPLLERAPVTLRVNHRAADREAVRTRAEQDLGVGVHLTALAPHGLILEERADLAGWSAYREGLVELQDEGSQLIALAAAAGSPTRVLDACAGAGGKTLALADLCGPGTVVTAMDPDAKKLRALEKRLKRANIEGVARRRGDLESLPADQQGRYDCVLVDAPCTGSGTFRRHPDLKWRLEEADLAREVARQKHLLTSAVAALRPGGRLVYATCSILREENEDIVGHALAHDPRLAPVPLADVWGADLSARLAATHEARIGPGPDARGPDGFYLAVLRRV